MKPETLLIRADASPLIGAGHVMRCLALAQAWRKEGRQAHFVGRVDSDALRQRIQEAGCGFIALGEVSLAVDLPETLTCFRRLEASWLVLDGYPFDSAYQLGLKQAGVRVLVVDDYHHLAQYHADMVLNQNIGAEAFDYGLGPQGRTLAGCRYVLLRPEFSNVRLDDMRAKGAHLRLLVTLGGADPENVTAIVLDALALLQPRDFQVRVVVGPANPHVDRLRRQAEGLGDFVEIVLGADMPLEMQWADFAITAAGSTCWELMFMGVPLACLVLADNQAGIAQGLQAAQAAVSLGRAEGHDARSLAESLVPFLADPEKRHRLSLRARGMVDGRGASRVVACMLGRNDEL